MRRMLANEDVDLLHTHLWPADLVGALANIRTGLPHVSHQHGTGKELLRGGVRPTLKRDISRRLMRLSGARFVAVSEAVRTHVKRVYGVHRNRISLIPNGFCVRQFPGRRRTIASGGDRLTVGYAGRFDEEKGIPHLIRAFARMKERERRARLRLAGAGPLESKCRQLCSHVGISDAVEFCGPVSDMVSFYASLDVFALPSLHSEGLPLVLVEAMSMGCVPVASNDAGVREVIEDGRHGFVVRPGDENELARALITLAEQPELRARMARAGRKRACTQFTADRMANNIAALYRTILAESEGCGAHTRRDEGGIAGA
jgi:glycosyltransferase involved in cell wall biosynthesis